MLEIMLDYVIYEEAIKLSEKGYNEKTNYGYTTKECLDPYNKVLNIAPGNLVYLDVSYSDDLVIMAPTYYEVQKWLRKEKNIYLNIAPMLDYYPETDKCEFSGDWSLYLADLKSENRFSEENDKLKSVFFKSYEEALREGIKRSLELI